MATPKRFKAYVCGIAYQHELGETDVTLWSSQEFCEDKHGVYQGTVELDVEIKGAKWVREQRPIEEWLTKTMAEWERDDNRKTVERFAQLLASMPNLQDEALKMLAIVADPKSRHEDKDMATTTLEDLMCNN